MVSAIWEVSDVTSFYRWGSWDSVSPITQTENQRWSVQPHGHRAGYFGLQGTSSLEQKLPFTAWQVLHVLNDFPIFSS